MAFSSYQYEFAGGDRTEQVKTITFKNTLPIENVFRIKFFKEEDISGVFQKKEFRYSFDDSIYSNWSTLTQQNVAAIQTRDEPEFFLEVRYTRTGIGAGTIQRFYIFYDSDTVPPGPTPDSSIDADYLGGQPPEYYLNRENFFGPYLDLQAQNVVGPGSGVYNGRLDTSMGTTLYFKRIADSSTATITESSTGIISIETTGTATGTYDSALDPSVQMPDPVGGIPAGTAVSDLDGDALSELWDSLLFPTAVPTLISPSNSLADNVANLQEIGDVINITFTAGFDRGAITPQYSAAEPFRSGLPNAYEYTGAQIAGTYPSTSLSDVQNATNYTVLQGNQSWQGYVSYDEGVQPFDSKGNPYNLPLPAGTTTAAQVSFEGVYPLFATTSNITTPSQQPLVSMISGNNIVFSMVAESGGQKQKFDIPQTWVTSRPLVGVETFNTVANQWEYQGGSPASSLTFWGPVGSTTYTIQGNVVNYISYEYQGTNRGSIDVRLKF